MLIAFISFSCLKTYLEFVFDTLIVMLIVVLLFGFAVLNYYSIFIKMLIFMNNSLYQIPLFLVRMIVYLVGIIFHAGLKLTIISYS